MKTLNTAATGIFLYLIDCLGITFFICLQSPAGEPLFIEGFGVLKSGFGTGYVYSLKQTKIVGDEIFREPEMFFIFFPDKPENIYRGVCPYSYQMDSLGISEKSMVIKPDANLVLNLKMQKSHVELANEWLEIIKEQGYLKFI
jgi:hypothetical protein